MDWEALRSEFPVSKRWAYFDHAAVAPLSRRAHEAMLDYARDVLENGDANYGRWVARIETVRGLFATLLHCDPLDLAFVKNTSEGIGIVAEGFPWQPGDNLVTAAEEYPANLYPWMNLENRGVEVRLIPTRAGRIEIDDVCAALDARTRLITISLVEYASGFRNDLLALGSLCRERGIYLFVDAIQGLGVIPLDLGSLPVDFLAADGHKWLLGPEGAGILWIRRELVDLLHPVGIGWNSVVGARNFARIELRLKPHAGRWESGSLNIGGITALGASLELILGIGIAAIEERILGLTDYLCRRAAASGLEVWSSRRHNDRSGIVSLVAKHDEPSRIVRYCREQGIIINHRAGRLRLSPHCYNTEEELERFLTVVTALA